MASHTAAGPLAGRGTGPDRAPGPGPAGGVPPGAALRRTAVFAALYLAATLAGRMTLIEGTTLSLVWPAAGVSALWFLAQRHARTWWPDVAAFAVCTLAANVWTGASPALAVCFAVANLAQVGAFLLLFGRLSPESWAAEGLGELVRVRQLWRLLQAAAGATLCGAAVVSAGMWLIGAQVSWLGTSVWIARNIVSIVLIGGVGLRLAALFRVHPLRPGPGSAWSAARDTLRTAPRWRKAEYAALVLASATAYVVAFGLNHGLPLAFPLLVVTVWAGLRFNTTFVVLHDLLVGATAILFTLYGHGPFATIGSPPVRAFVAQAFVAMVAVVGLALALGRDERDALLRQLAAAEESASAQAGLLATIVDAMHDGLVVIDSAGRFLMRNRAAADLLDDLGPPDAPAPGTADAAAPGTAGVDVGHFGLFHPDGTLMDEAELPYRQALAGREIRAVDLLVRNRVMPEGRMFSVSATRLPTEAGDEGEAAVVVVFHDVTAERRDRDELAAFAGVVAHDLRNPLSAVDGWIDVLDETVEAVPGGAPDMAVESIARIRHASARMRNLINDLLTHSVSRAAALSPVPVDLGETVREVIATRGGDDAAAGRERRPRPRFHVGDLPRVQADPVLLRQLLDNLIGNATKYVAPGAVPEITVTAGPAEEEGWVRVEVADRGIGIPPGQHEAVFENFHRAHHTAGYTGSGLGLAICKRIVERHGGTIGARDNPGGGTRFHFTLPAAP
ncbi:ATP-binding protein [Planomonospora sp. ID91781]|uniref:ATP-binding protein n=1 Tax=Planomonospora sp. ID91781 TaxID=2738135 RepID=UPI0018C41DD6|nr:ATP-binding protein [Planomonospora sp. ID91781]